MKITKKGRELAWKLNPSMGTTEAIQETCSELCRVAAAYMKIQAGWTNIDFSGRPAELRRREKKEERLAAKMDSLVADLPHVDGCRITLYLNADPRGVCSLVMPDGRFDTLGGTARGLSIP